MSKYAENTEVGIDRSKAEIEKILIRYGATSFFYGYEGAQAALGFKADGRMVRMELTMPDMRDFETTDTGRARTSEASIRSAWEQECKRMWRSLALVVKAKLEAVESGIATFEDEFMAYIVLPNNSRVGDFMRPQIAHAYETGAMPKMLPGGQG